MDYRKMILRTVKNRGALVTLLFGILAASCKFGEAAPPPKITIEDSNLEIGLAVTHEMDDPDKTSEEYPNLALYRSFKDAYIYIEGYYSRGRSGKPVVEGGFTGVSFKSGMTLRQMARGDVTDTISVPLYQRTDYSDYSRKYSKFTTDPKSIKIYFWIWYFYSNTIWDELVPPVGKQGPFTVTFEKNDTSDPDESDDPALNSYSGDYSFNVISITPCSSW